MCGIAAFSGKKNLTPTQVRIVTNKMKILALYNESRGKHGCGLYINGEIFKGFDDISAKKDTKLASDFIADEDWIMPDLNTKVGNVIIFHARQATYGSHIKENNHPFLIEAEDPKNNLIGVHNGSISNIWTLCRENDIDHTKIHVDSRALYELINKVGVGILEQYDGFAALVWTKASEPNSLYVFHGAARRIKGGDVFEERPMYFLKTQEGIYFSSMSESLNAIRENLSQKVEELDHNYIFKVTNGNFTASKRFIDRYDSNLSKVVVHTPVHTSQNAHVRNTLPAYNKDDTRDLATLALYNESRQQNIDSNTPDQSPIWNEPLPLRAKPPRDRMQVYFWKGRYHKTGGILCVGVLYLTNKGRIGEKADTDTKPYYFWAGVMLNGVEAYNKMEDESKVANSWVFAAESHFAFCISKYSYHPVTNLPSEGIGLGNFVRYAWYANGQKISTKFSPKFSSRTYIINDGFLENIISSDKDDRALLNTKSEAQLALELENAPQNQSVVKNTGCTNNICTSQKSLVEDGGAFDYVFRSFEDAMRELTEPELEAIRQFAGDQLRQDSPLDPDDQEIEGYMTISMRTGIAAGKTIREAFNDTTGILDMYVDMLLSNKTKELSETQNFPTPARLTNEEEEFYNMFGHMPTKGRTDPASTTPPFKEGNVRGGYAQNEYVEEESNGYSETLIDRASEADEEQKKFLKEEIMRQITDKMNQTADVLTEVNDIADELQGIDDDAAQEFANILYKGLDNLKHQLSAKAEELGLKEIGDELNKALNV